VLSSGGTSLGQVCLKRRDHARLAHRFGQIGRLVIGLSLLPYCRIAMVLHCQQNSGDRARSMVIAARG